MALLDLEGYEQAVAYSGEYEALPPGGYVCRILDTKVEDWASGNGRSLVVELDICEGEKKDFFQRQYDADTSKYKKWRGIHRQTLPKGHDSKAMGWFKGFIRNIEDSNNFTWNKDTDTLKGKLIGCVFGREEYYNTSTGKSAWATKIFRTLSVDAIRGGKFSIPEDKPLISTAPTFASSNALEEIIDDDDLPF